MGKQTESKTHLLMQNHWQLVPLENLVGSTNGTTWIFIWARSITRITSLGKGKDGETDVVIYLNAKILTLKLLLIIFFGGFQVTISWLVAWWVGQRDPCVHKDFSHSRFPRIVASFGCTAEDTDEAPDNPCCSPGLWTWEQAGQSVASSRERAYGVYGWV